VQKERSAFLESTRELRDRHYQKELELKAELAKQTPDAKKAAELQKEVSGFENELDQKRLEHQLKMKKDYRRSTARVSAAGMAEGWGPGYGMGPGGKGPGRGGCPAEDPAGSNINHTEESFRGRRMLPRFVLGAPCRVQLRKPGAILSWNCGHLNENERRYHLAAPFILHQ